MQKYFFLFLLILICCDISAQILDDSTKQVYSNNTVQFVYESDLLNNTNEIHNPDSSLYNFHKTDKLLLNNWLYQDLGNSGTASQSILIYPNYDVAQQTGYNVFSLYAPNPQQFKYYNTKSPYTRLNYTQSGNGYSRFDFSHSQNINPRLNLTLAVGKFNSSKQINTTTVEDRLVNNWDYNITSNYTSKSKKYQLLAAFYHFNHLQNEQGGIKKNSGYGPVPIDSLLSNYKAKYSTWFANGVQTRERWNNIHIYQQYKLANGFQIYNITDRNSQKYFYTDPSLAANSATSGYNISDTTLLKKLASRTDTLRQNFKFSTFSNLFGLKGRYNGFDYRVYAKYRQYSFVNNISPFVSSLFNKKKELFIGGQMAYYLKDSVNNVIVDAEFKQSSKGFFNNYFVDAKLNFYNLYAQLNISQRPPGIFYQAFANSIVSWDSTKAVHATADIRQTQILASYKLKYRSFEFTPSIRNTILTNYTYLNENMSPTQYSTNLNITNFESHISFKYKSLLINNQTIFTIVDNESVYHAPKLINNTRIAFLFHNGKRLNLHTGLDIYYKSKYYADAYSPMLQQFYLQSTYYAWGSANKKGYAAFEPFVSFNIKRVRLALKMSNLNQLVSRLNQNNTSTLARNATSQYIQSGVYTTPYYLAAPTAFFLKVDWPLFD